MSPRCSLLLNGMPDPTLPAPTVIEVVEAIGASTTYALTFDITIQDGDYPLLRDDRLGPEADVAVKVTYDEGATVLVRGPVAQQQIRLVAGGDGSELHVLGADATAPLGREARVKVWSDTTDEAAIIQTLNSAAIDPSGVSLPTSVVHAESKNALVQREPDLHFLRRLARRNGCWAWLEYDAISALPKAQIRRPPVSGMPTVDLYLEGENRNIDEVAIQWDVERIVSTEADNRDGFAGSDQSGSVERSPLAPLGSKALGDIVTAARSARLSVPVDDASDLIVRSEAALIDASWFVGATVTARGRRLNRVLRVPGLVALHGAGKRHTGSYLVAAVTHRITDDDHTMTAILLRNGWN